MEASSKILRLTAENIKRLTAVEITPDKDGNLIVIGGRNDQGKSSCLDAIYYALGGAPGIPPKVLRKGTKGGFVRIDLGDIIVTRSFTESGGSNLTVSNGEGAVFKSPQALLDKLVGKLSFDPLEFSRQSPEEQADTLKRIVGLDFTKLDQERAGFYTERTAINRTVTQIRAQLSGMEFHQGLPKEEVSIEAIYAEMRKVTEQNRANDAIRASVQLKQQGVFNAEYKLQQEQMKVDDLAVRVTQLKLELQKAEELLIRATNELEVPKEALNAAKLLHETALGEVEGLVDATDTELKEQVLKAKEINGKLMSNKAREAAEQAMLAKSKQSDELTAKIDKIDEDKKKAVAESKFPVPGLSFDEDGGVTLDGLPFCQASSSQQLRVSVAIGLALNPKLRVLLVRDGSLLDPDSLKLLGQLAKEHDAQVWLERVSDGKEVTVVIEDGAVQQKEAE